MRKGTPKYIGKILMARYDNFSVAHIWVHHILQRSIKKNPPALVLEASPCNLGVPSWVSLLPSHYNKGSSALGTFSHLKKAAIMPNLVN